MRILHVGKYYPPEPGGIENFLRDLAERQAGNGHHVHVLVHGAAGERRPPVQTEHGVRVIRARTFGQLVYAPLCPGFPGRLAAELHSFHPDVVHAHVPNTSAFWLLGAKKAPMVVHWHADVVRSKVDSRLSLLYPAYRRFEQRLLARAQRVAATSASYLRASEPLALHRARCRVVPLGTDSERLQAAARTGALPCPLPEDEPVVLSAGRFTYYKGYEYLIRAAARTPRGRFVLAGDGPLWPRMAALVRELGLQERVLMPGKVTEGQLMALFKRCDMVCLSSIERTEAFGVVLLEAMAFAKPMVTTRIPGSGVSEVNQENVTGLAANPADPEGLADCLNRLMENPEQRLSLGRAARERLEQRFTISRVALEMDAVYAEAVESFARLNSTK